ncbi:Type VII secretion system protein EccCb1 (plasmid) [Tsukamurella tyrosinosolvens]|nr:FtsK/SpoIIIE domain-containing protein [Tsukamurella tyrosinosolvens]VEH94243.1 Type VII secretion system protein EccCb1 [Tsukamurella tyrosinosolvens]
MCSQFIDQAVLGDLLQHLSFRYSLAVNSATHSTVMIGTDAAATMVGKKGGLKGKILRRFTTDAAPVEVAAFHHEAPYVKKTVTSTGELSSDNHAPVQDPILPFSLFSSRDFTPNIVDGEVVENREETGLKMANVLLEKIERFEDERVLDLWKPSLREPLSLINLNLNERETEGLRIRIGDIDVPEKHTRLPWSLNFGGSTPHYVVSGAAKSGRTTLLQTMVICGALQHGPQRLAFMAIDNGTGKLSEIATAPNVAAYARPNDTKTADRILGEAGRLIARRTELMDERGVFSVDDYLKSKAADPVADDAYGYMVILIDGIGGFLGEDRAENAERLIPLLDAGAKVGVHIVYTADNAASGSSGNVPTYKIEVPGNVILPNTDYSGARIKAEVRMSLGDLIPGEEQPGRSVDTVTLKQARTAVPINIRIQPDSMKKGMPVFKVRDYGAQIREIASNLAQALNLVPVPPVLPAPAVIDYDFMWDHIASMVKRDRHPLSTLLPLGFRMDTLAVAPTPTIDPARGWYSQNLLIFGEKQSGRTNILRTTLESVMRQYTPDEAVIYVVDPLHQLLGDRDRLYERGFMRRAKFEERAEQDGTVTKVRTRGPGYVTSREDIDELAQTLVRMMAKRRPHDDSDSDDLQNRTFFRGPEVYVFIDNFNALVEGYMHKSPFDEVKVGGLSVAALLALGADLGVHFIITDNQKFYERSFDAPLYAALQGAMQTPMLQLAASPQVGQPIRQAYHLKPDRWRPGQGRLIVDAADYVMVQAALMGAAEQHAQEPPAA